MPVRELAKSQQQLAKKHQQILPGSLCAICDSTTAFVVISNVKSDWYVLLLIDAVDTMWCQPEDDEVIWNSRDNRA